MPPAVLRAYHYHLKGLTARETAVLINISVRTVQRWALQYGFKQRANPETMLRRVARLYDQGFSYREIGKAIQKSRTTVYYYLKEARKGA